MRKGDTIDSALKRVVKPTTGTVDDVFECEVLRARLRQRVCIERQFQLERNAFGTIVSYAANNQCAVCPLGRRIAAAFPEVAGDRVRPKPIGLVGFPRSGTTLERIVTDPDGEDEGLPSIGARCEQDLLDRDPLGDKARMAELNHRLHDRGVCRMCGSEVGEGGVDGVCASRVCRGRAMGHDVAARPPVDRERLMQLHEQGLGAQKIGELFGFSAARAHDLIRKEKLKRNQLTPRTRSEVRRKRREIVWRMLQEGKTREQIAGALGITLPSANELARHALRRTGGTVPPRLSVVQCSAASYGSPARRSDEGMDRAEVFSTSSQPSEE